jgi:hypothetical protein
MLPCKFSRKGIVAMPEQAEQQPEQDNTTPLLAIYDQLSGQPRQDFLAMAGEAGYDTQPLYDKDFSDGEARQAWDTEMKERTRLSWLISEKGLEKLADNSFAYRYRIGPAHTITTAAFKGQLNGEDVFFRLARRDQGRSNAYDSELGIELPYPTPEPFDIEQEEKDLNFSHRAQKHRIEYQSDVDGYKIVKVGKEITVRTWSDSTGKPQGSYTTEGIVLDRDSFAEAGQDTYVAGWQREYRTDDAVPAFIEIVRDDPLEYPVRDGRSAQIDSAYLSVLDEMLDNAQPVQDNIERKYVPRRGYGYIKGEVELVTIETEQASAT